MDAGVTPRRHNPVDSICRKLRTIRRRDQEADSPFPIPKLQSSSYGSPHASLRHNLEAVLRKRGIQPDDGPECEGSAAVLTPAGSSAPRRDSCPTPTLSTPGTPINATYTVTSTLREKGEAVPLYNRPWQRTCSTPAVQSRDVYFTPRCPTPMEVEREGGKTLSHTLLSYNLNFASSDTSSILDTELACPALVVKRLSMGDGAVGPAESRRDGMAEVSLICEEDLLDTIFQACDTQCRGKVYVSHIVDYLRHTTSRSSEDSGLEELCNMLDPEHKDISIDLHTYHAIMKEWIEDCRNQGTSRNEDLTQESVRPADGLAAKRSVLLNMTSGSLEAFGGEVSRADLETSDLVFCVADLQFNNQKLQQEVGKLKQAVEVMEETNQKLLEQNEELKAQTRAGQQLLQKERMLKEEVEEMKMTLSSSEESRARASAQSKHMERENQSLLAKIACLEKENVKVSMEVDELQKKLKKVCDLHADLQVQTLTFDAVIAEKDAEIQEKARQTEELKTAVEEYSSVLELLRVEKSRLERQMQLMLMQPEMTLINQTGSGSLQAELALAQQSPSEGVEGSSLSLASSLDETLDREVLLLLRGPAPEQTALEFRTLLASLTQEFEEDTCAVLAQLRGLLNLQGPQDVELKLQGLRGQLAERRGRWMCAVGQLQQYTDSLEREMTKVTSDLRRSRTDMLHLSVRVQEQENKKQQLQEELDQMKTEHNSREARSQTPAHCCQGPAVISQDKEEEGSRDPAPEEEEGLRDSPLDSSFLISQQSRATRDSGVQTEVLGGLTPFRKCTSEQVLDLESPEGLVDSEDLSDDPPQQGPELQQEEGRLPECTRPADTHGQAVCCEASEPVSLSHSHTRGAGELPQSLGGLLPSPQPQGQGLTPPKTSTLSPASIQPGPGQSITLPASTPQETGVMERGPEGGKVDMPILSYLQKLTQDQLPDVPTVLDRSCLLPVVEEDEPVTEGGQQVALAEGDAAGMTKMGGQGTVTGPNSDYLHTAGGSGELTPEPSLVAPPPPGTRKDSPTLRSRFRRDLEISSSMEAIAEQKALEESKASEGPKNADDTSVISEDSRDAAMDAGNSLSSSDREIEAEFHRLSLSCKCDMFTLEKRLRLEERSRDLAEENVCREVSSCQGLLQALIPRCEDDNQAMEIIQRLQKNLEILVQSMTRVSSRSEMLGAIHQESRMGKAVEVMIHHVENLRRTYTKEHTELLELRESLVQNERSFGTERDDFRNKKQPSFNKPAARRVSIAAIPRGIGRLPLDMAKEGTETDAERLARRSPWNIVGRSSQRAPLKRFISSGGWQETDGPALTNRFGYESDSHSEEEMRTEATERRSSLTQLGIKFTSLIMPAKTVSSGPGPVAEQATPCQVKASRSPWLWVCALMVVSALLLLLASLILQPAVDAAPVGTGDSWMTIQQLLWPYTGLQHNGQPPV
ncbi:inositol 1,4,5-triphosphate receptor associated 2 isoform X2 [Electrophorus electricus]|nr:inositol 1,4,5-triphosphate receptor associated 2 isoform X2 [Electrophorus electricus]